MASGLENLVAKTRILAGLAKARELTDRQLLQQFADGDETAFTALVDRYGSLVLGICRRILQHTHDAEDAFQATFMVLAKKAGKVAWKDSVANWLHGVACRIAFQVRREKARHAACGVAEGDSFATPQATDDPSWSELKPVLDEELDRLPARYRIPLILCCLEGKSRDEAALQLGWTVGSLKGRLERGREMLKSRLARRGLTLSAALAATLVSTAGAKAAVPLTLGLETVRAGMAMLAGETAGVVSIQAVTLAHGALHAMFITKLKYAAAVLLAVTTLGLGTGYVTYEAMATGQDRRSASGDAGERQGQDRPRTNDAGQREERKASPIVSGIVQTVDAKKINILVGRGEPDGQTFDLSKDVKIVIREGRETKDAKLADVQPKTRVTLTLDEAKKVVQRIDVVPVRRPEADGERGRGDGLNFRGYVSGVDAAKNTISFQSGGRGEAPVKIETFQVAKDAKVTIRTGRMLKVGKLADVQPKTWIQAKLDDAKKTIVAIEVSVATTRFGPVSEVDANSITLTFGGRGDDAKSVTFPLSKDVKVFFYPPGQGRGREGDKGGAKEMKVADLTAKAIVTLQLDDELKVVQSIEVQLPSARGTITNVDAKRGLLQLKMARETELNAEFTKDARIVINGKAGAVDQLTNGLEVHVVLTPDRMRVMSLQTPPPEGREEE